MVKRNKLLWKKGWNYYKNINFYERKVDIKNKDRIFEFSDKRKVDIMDSWE